MSSTTDPLRAEIEAVMRRMAWSGLRLPCAAVRTARRTVGEALGFVRTAVNIATDGLLGWDVDAGVPRFGTAGAGAGGASPSVVVTSAPRRPPEAVATTGSPTGTAGDLAIPGYEDLAASHIVARLPRLDRGQLEAIRQFEVAHRGRRTVIGKIDQLLAER
jgi:hypothetical protein